MRIEDVPTRYRRLYRRARAGKSRKAAIRSHCLMCCGWQYVEVQKCTARTCPLYPYRLSAVPTDAGAQRISPDADYAAVVGTAGDDGGRR